MTVEQMQCAGFKWQSVFLFKKNQCLKNGVRKCNFTILQMNLRSKLKLNYSLGVVPQNDWADK